MTVSDPKCPHGVRLVNAPAPKRRKRLDRVREQEIAGFQAGDQEDVLDLRDRAEREDGRDCGGVEVGSHNANAKQKE